MVADYNYAVYTITYDMMYQHKSMTTWVAFGQLLFLIILVNFLLYALIYHKA